MGDDKKPDLMTVKEVAAMMRVDPKTVLRWRSLGRLRAVGFGRVIRFRRAEVIRAIDKYEFGDPSPPRDPSMW